MRAQVPYFSGRAGKWRGCAFKSPFVYCSPYNADGILVLDTRDETVRGAEKCIFRKFCKFLAGSFSAVSKRNFARKYAFDSIFQALQDLHLFAPLQSQNFRKKIGLKNQHFS